jgi:recombination protein RecT
MNENPTAVIVRALASAEWGEKLANALPPHVTRERFLSAAVTAVRTFKEAAEVDRESLYTAVLVAAQAGLVPDGRQGAIVSFNTKLPNGAWQKTARFMPMVEGIIHQMGLAGIAAWSVSVYEKDTLHVWMDDHGQHVEHTPVMFGERGPRMGALAVARILDTGSTYVETMDMEEIGKVRNASRSKDKQGNPVGPWKDWPERMEQKSVLHRLAKRLPKQIELPKEPEDTPPAIDTTAESVPETTATAPSPKRGKTLQAVVDAEPSTAEVIDEGEPPFEAAEEMF